MNICVNLNPRFRYFKEVSEVNIKYTDIKNTILEDILTAKDKKINISIDNEKEFIESNSAIFLKEIQEKYPELDISFRIKAIAMISPDRTKKFVAELLKNENAKYFFEKVATNWDEFFGLLSYEPSEIYIGEALGFELDKVSKIAHSKGVKVRVFPNVAQSSWRFSPSIKKFFIRPEDVEFYSQYVDTFELYGKAETASVYYKIYAIDKKWAGKLNEIIIDFDGELDSRHILDTFAKKRSVCEKKCLKNGKCSICDAIAELSTVLGKHNLSLKEIEI
jgi:hypothetical protein